MRRHDKIQALLNSDDPELDNFSKKFELPDCVVREIVHQKARMEHLDEGGRKTRSRPVQKKSDWGRVIQTENTEHIAQEGGRLVVVTREVHYHATKGRRSYRSYSRPAPL